MANSYIDLASIKSVAGLNLGTSTLYDARLRAVTEAVSRQLDRYCNRRFFYTVESRDFDGNGKKELLVSDLISIGTLSEDSNADGTFETAWASSDFILYPRDASPTSRDFGRPYTRIQVSNLSNGSQDTFLEGQSNYRIAGTWGYSKYVRAAAATGTLVDGTGTTLVLTTAATGTIEIGHTLLINDEQVYVTATTGTAATVTRANNGTTGTAHLGQAVGIIEYPQPVVESCFIQLARLWKRKDAAFANQIGMPETGMLVTWRGGLDPDSTALLRSFRKIAV
jgi:hypothetical protein